MRQKKSQHNVALLNNAALAEAWEAGRNASDVHPADCERCRGAGEFNTGTQTTSGHDVFEDCDCGQPPVNPYAAALCGHDLRPGLIGDDIAAAVILASPSAIETLTRFQLRHSVGVSEKTVSMRAARIVEGLKAVAQGRETIDDPDHSLLRDLQGRHDAMRKTLIACAGEFPPGPGGEPDIGGLHASIVRMREGADDLFDQILSCFPPDRVLAVGDSVGTLVAEIRRIVAEHGALTSAGGEPMRGKP